MTVDTKELVTTMAYLIGVKREILTVQFESIEALDANKNARIIRYLSKLRSSLFLHFKATESAMRYDLKNIDSLPDWYCKEDIRFLAKCDIPIIKVNTNTSDYMVHFCKLIANYIDACQPLFPEWVNWQYIKEMGLVWWSRDCI